MHVSGSSKSEPPAKPSKRAQRKWAREQEAQRIAQEQEAQRIAEELKQFAQEQEAQRIAQEQEAQRIAQEQEAQRIAQEQEAQRIAQEQEAQRIAQEQEAQRIAQEQEAQRIAQEQEAQRIAQEQEAQRIAQEQEAQRIAQEKEAQRIAQEKEAQRIAQEQEAQRIAQEQEAQRIAQEKEAQRIAQEQEAQRIAQEQEAQRIAQEQEAQRIAQEKEAQRLAQEKEAQPVAQEQEVSDQEETSSQVHKEEARQQEEASNRVEEELVQQEATAIEPESREAAALINDKPSPDDRLREMISSYPLLEGNALYSAERKSEDGTVVVGEGFINGRAQPFIARDDGGKIGIVGLFDLNDSLNNATLYSSVLQSAVQTFVQDGMRCSSFDQYGVCISAGALYSHNAGKVNGANWQGEVTAAYRINDDWAAGLGYQAPSYRFDVGNDTMRNRAGLFGLFAEYGTRTRPGVFARVALGYQQGDLSINRSYLTASGVDRSNGDTTVAQRAVSTQGGYVFAVRNASIMPYLGIDYLRTRLGDYTETSGQFPVRFNARTDENVYGTVGLSGHLRFTDQTVISAGVKHVQRLSRSNDPVSASVPAFDPFVVGAQSTRQWSEFSIGGRFATPVKASSLDIGYRRRFASGAAIAQDMGSVFFTMGF
ncbi:autotransporter outer membrane beta-barrel domain-containing protein [Mycetohabitans sp. B8]|uniref:autotransporter outer membrane beta-barrel domain-containing protein n=1 Tax=Mycetohabitans sp. B8 TaxID=2841845 RepID=UPI001F37B81D|nr:autotransporter outer membrane beta-barrel domain-containing protein [Mycetohabitans sp. B8]